MQERSHGKQRGTPRTAGAPIAAHARHWREKVPKQITTTVYQASELKGNARDAARDWCRTNAICDAWCECVLEDFATIAEAIGLTLECRPVPLVGGGTRDEPAIWFSGFGHQSDGAGFDGRLAHRKGSAAALHSHAPRDDALRVIAETIATAQKRNFYQLSAQVHHPGRCGNNIEVSVERESPNGQPMTDDAEAMITGAMNELAQWLFEALRAEHEHIMSDHGIDELLAANEWSFTADGRHFTHTPCSASLGL